METAEFSTTPIVPVLKPNGQVRICGDHKVSVNKYLDLTQYPLPHIEEVFERPSDGQVFSKLDLPDAYLQVELDDESKRHVVITTHRGLYRYNRLCFGWSSAPAIFQSIIEQILRSVKGVQPYLVDIALKNANLDDHLRVLRHVVQTLLQAGVKLKRQKCVFVQHSIKYLGHVFSGDGLRPDPSKVEAVVKAPPPDFTGWRSSLFSTRFTTATKPDRTSNLSDSQKHNFWIIIHLRITQEVKTHVNLDRKISNFEVNPWRHVAESTSTIYTRFGISADCNASTEESARFDIDTRAESSRPAAGNEKFESARDAQANTEVRRGVQRTRIKEKNLIYTYVISFSWILIKSYICQSHVQNLS